MRIDKSPNGEFRYGEPVVADQDEAEFGVTPSQTVGPYVHIGLIREGSENIGRRYRRIAVITLMGGNAIVIYDQSGSLMPRGIQP